MPSRAVVIVVRCTRNVRKYIRGYAAELNDSELVDTLNGEQPVMVDINGDLKGIFWQRPRISAPNALVGGDRLCMWSVWESQLSQIGRTRLQFLVNNFPTHIRVFWQQVGQDETLRAFNLRWLGIINWVNA